MYADDTQVTLTSDSMAELFESARKEMMNISEWMRINKQSLNPQKTEYMIIGHPRRTNKILSHEPQMLNGAEIKHVKETKSLGIILDEGLNWNEQYKKVKGKVSGGLWSLKMLMKIVPQSQLVNTYHALVEGHRVPNTRGVLINGGWEPPKETNKRGRVLINGEGVSKRKHLNYFTSTRQWSIFRTKFHIKIILSFGHCLPKLINGGGGDLNKGSKSAADALRRSLSSSILTTNVSKSSKAKDFPPRTEIFYLRHYT